MIMQLALAVAAMQAAPAVSGPQISRAEAEKRLANCGSRRFESTAEFPVNGKIRRAHLSLCAPDSDTAEQWLATLQRNEASIRAQTGLPDSAKDKLLGDLKAAIDSLRGVNSLATTRNLGMGPRPSMVLPKNDFEIAALPPLPAPIKANPAASTAGAGSTGPAKSTSLAAPSLKPRLSVKCAALGDSPIACDRVAVDDMLIIQADENLLSPLTLTFRQAKSGAETDVPVGRLKQGQAVRLRVPASICKGVGRATFDIKVSGSGTGKLPYSDLIGPLKKDC